MFCRSYRQFCTLVQRRKIYQQTKTLIPLTPECKHEIENYWSQRINPINSSTTVPNDKKFYVLSMFPYPSGKLHMGHVRVYTISDVLARFHRLNGSQIIHPMGWDAFGLPAENAAISQGVAPDTWTYSNIQYMKKQLVKLGISFDWQRELATCSPQYYKWTQFIFLKLYEKGLAYQKEAFVNWDPVDQTVLAEEQVDENGCSWRSGAKVEKKLLKQWFIRTTRFSHSLLEGLDELSVADWKDIIKLQKHWIGDCNGYQFEMPVIETRNTLNVWTTNPESLKTARFIALKPGHALEMLFPELKSTESKRIPLHVENPLTKDKLPVIVTNLLEYADGCDVALGDPTNDELAAQLVEQFAIPANHVNSGGDLKADEICAKALEENWGGYRTSSKLRDWLVSRQRYWGTPIPIIHCSSCGSVPVPMEQLPVSLPQSSQNSGGTKGHAALCQSEEFVNVSCPKCGGSAKRETDTMDTFVDSTWYFMRYLDPHNNQEPFDVLKAKDALPVDIYIGGKEHAVLHLFYARFMSHFLHSLGWLPEREPFRRLLVQGMVMGRSYRVKGSGKYLKPEEIDFSGQKPVEAATGNALVVTWEKMSKSKFNGVEPETVWNEQGIDTTRLLILADVSPRASRNWSKDTYPGILNWQERMWGIINDFVKKSRGEIPTRPLSPEEQQKYDDQMFDARNFYLKGATFNIHTTHQISIAISKMQGLTNSIRKLPKHMQLRDSLQTERALATMIIILSPLAPHFASEMWSAFVDNAQKLATDIDWEKSVLEQRWPEIDDNYKVEFIGKVNGQDSCSFFMYKKELNQLDVSKAMELVQQSENYIKYCSHKKVVQTTFDLYPGIQAVLNITTEQVPKPVKS